MPRFFNGMEFLVTHAEGMDIGKIHVVAEALAGVGGASGGMVAHDLVNGWQETA